jgi:hypothetical protein
MTEPVAGSAGPQSRSACLNCQTPLEGRFCHGCGQEDRSSLFTLRQLIAEAAHELFDLDGKLLRSLRLLLRPGALTIEYLAGRRARYVSPLRLYLIASLALVASNALFGSEGPLNVKRSIAAAEIRAGRPPAPTKERRKRPEEEDRMLARAEKWFPTVMLALPPVVGLMLMAMHRRRYRHYSAHLYFSLHAQAFISFLFAVDDLLFHWPVALIAGSRAAIADRVVGGLVDLGVCVYLVVAMRRVYQIRWRSAVFRSAALIFGFIAVSLALIFGTFHAAKVLNRWTAPAGAQAAEHRATVRVLRVVELNGIEPSAS